MSPQLAAARDATRRGRHEAGPLVRGGSRVTVDGRPICAVCGRGVEAVGPGRWRHAAPGRPPPRRSKWLAPTIAELRECRTYAAFVDRYPWAASPESGGVLATTEGQWREGMSRLARYDAGLRALRRTRTLPHGANPYLDLVRILAEPPPEPDDPLEAFAAAAQPAVLGLPYGLARLLNLAERRRELVELFSWAIPTDDALGTLSRYAPLVDAGAGMGYWTALLQARAVDAVAYDLFPPGGAGRNEYHRQARGPWAEVRQGSAVAAARRHPERTLVLCWPPYEDDAASYDALRAYGGDVVIHVGERGGASGSVRFHRELELNWTLLEQVDLPHWPRLDDRVLVYRRNPVRRPHVVRDRCDECRRFVPTGSLGRCDACFAQRPPALALRVGRHREEYSREVLDALHPALRRALESSPSRIHPPRGRTQARVRPAHAG